MSDTKPYTDRVKAIAKSDGVELSDEQALDRLMRVVSVAKAIYQTKHEHNEQRIGTGTKEMA